MGGVGDGGGGSTGAVRLSVCPSVCLCVPGATRTPLMVTP